MSHFVWSLSKLVNDPTTEIINEIRQRIFRRDGTSTRDIENEISVTVATTNNTDPLAQASNAATTTSKTICSKEKPKLAEVRSRSIQVDSGSSRRRQISVQCQISHHKRPTKSTSTLHVTSINRSTGESRIAIKKDAETMPMKKKVCKLHRQTLSALEHWPNQQRAIKNPNIGKIGQLKETFLRIANSLKIEKIQCVPPYHPPEKPCIKLYKCESFNITTNKQVKRKKNISKTSKVATTEKLKAV